ncbi:MAG TPA: hypothetical protein VMU18_03810 [Rhodoblastus sp.]|nr:hypothetical protein [Rhodoblastus sp.]
MTTYYLKDANGNQFPVNSTPIGAQASALSLCVTPATDALAEPGGAPIAGVAMPSGGAGLTGWLSAAYSKLATIVTTLAGTLIVSDAQNVPCAGAVAMSVGTTYAPARSVGVLCSVAGNAVLQFPDNSTATVQLSPGWQSFPFACTQIVAAGTTATATYFNLK